MSNKTVNQLTELAESPAVGDYVLVWDTDGAASKKVSISNFIAAENFWARNTTTISPENAGDTLDMVTGNLVVSGAGTNGLLISGARTTAVSVTGNATDALKVSGGTFTRGLNLGGTLTTGISIGACTTAVTITGAVTTGYNIAGNATDAFKITSGTITNGLNIASAVTTGVLIAGATTTGISITGNATDAINISSGTYTTAINIAGTTTTAINVAAGIVSIGVTGTRRTLSAATPLFSMFGTSSVTTGNIRNAEINTYYTGTTSSESIEGFASIVTSNVKTGNWVNSILGKIDYSTNGSVTGLAGAICAEIDMPGSSPAGGHYTCYEAEIIAPASSGFGVATSFFIGNVSGANVAGFQTSGYLMEFTGLGTPTSGKIIDECTAAAASHALRILVDGTPYYILLQSNVDA